MTPRATPRPRMGQGFLGLTLTGADESTPVHALQWLSQQDGVELAFLYSPTGAGWRFVRCGWLQEVLPRLSGRLALHVCGLVARRQLLDGALGSLMPSFARVQVNGPVSAAEAATFAARVPALVTQHDPVNAALATLALPRHSVLVDGSNGTGLLPERWERPDTAKPVGFAGGLSPENIDQQLEAIAAVATGRWWIDVESGVRDADDRFDLERAQAIVNRVAACRARWGGDDRAGGPC